MFPWLLWECCCRGLCCVLLEPRKARFLVKIMGQQMWKWVGQPSCFWLFALIVFPNDTFKKMLSSSLWTILNWVFLVGLLIGSLPFPGYPSSQCIDFDELCSLLRIVKNKLPPHYFHIRFDIIGPSGWAHCVPLVRAEASKPLPTPPDQIWPTSILERESRAWLGFYKFVQLYILKGEKVSPWN